MIILPLDGRSSRVSSFSSVVFPAPDCPTMMTNSRGSTCNEIRSSDGMPPFEYVFVTLSNRIISPIIANLDEALAESSYACFLRRTDYHKKISQEEWHD